MSINTDITANWMRRGFLGFRAPSSSINSFELGAGGASLACATHTSAVRAAGTIR